MFCVTLLLLDFNQYQVNVTLTVQVALTIDWRLPTFSFSSDVTRLICGETAERSRIVRVASTRQLKDVHVNLEREKLPSLYSRLSRFAQLIVSKKKNEFFYFAVEMRDIPWYDELHRFFISLDQIFLFEPSTKHPQLTPYQSHAYRRCNYIDKFKSVRWIDSPAMVEFGCLPCE